MKRYENADVCDTDALARRHAGVVHLTISETRLVPAAPLTMMPHLKTLALTYMDEIDADAVRTLLAIAPALECLKIESAPIPRDLGAMLATTRVWYLAIENARNRDEKIDLSGASPITAMYMSDSMPAAFALPLGLRTLDAYNCDELDPACLEPLRLLRHIVLPVTGTDIEMPVHVWSTLRVLGCAADRVPEIPTPFPPGPPIDVCAELVGDDGDERGYLRRLRGASRRIRRIIIVGDLGYEGPAAFPAVIGGPLPHDDDYFESYTDLEHELRTICPKARTMYEKTAISMTGTFSDICRVFVNPNDDF